MLIFFLHVQWEGLAEPLTKDNNINQQHQQLINFIRDGAFEFYAMEWGWVGGGGHGGHF